MSKQDFEAANKRPKPPPFSIWLNWAQRKKLDELSNGEPWATYIKRIIFSGKLVPAQKNTPNPLDRKLIAKLISVIGKSRLSSNVNQLAKAANSGSLQVNEEVVKALMQTCRTIEWMRITLIKALGLKPHQPKNGENEKKNDLER